MNANNFLDMFSGTVKTVLPSFLFEKATTPIFGSTAMFVGAYMLSLWALNFVVRDPTFVDSAWPMGFVAISFISMLYSGVSARSSLLFILTTIWGLRLAVYLFRRWQRHGPDQRYVQLLSRVGGNYHVASLISIFGLQGVLMWVVSLPLQAASLNSSTPITFINMLGAAAIIAGTVIEAVADFQMSQFRRVPANKDKVMNSGLWAYSRHPNYFGDALVWWGIFFLSFDSVSRLWAAIGPITMTYLLRFISGVPTIENKLKATKPAYREYVKDTSAFVPLPKGLESDVHQRTGYGVTGRG